MKWNIKLRRRKRKKYKKIFIKTIPVKEKRIKVNHKEYRQVYLVSKHWQEIKKRLYLKYKYCQLCSSARFLNIHHITYARLGFEDETDLIVLCEDCHINKVHKKIISKKELFRITGGSEHHKFKQIIIANKKYKSKFKKRKKYKLLLWL